MKIADRIAGLSFCIMLTALGLHFFGHEAFAAEKASNWRVWYDLVLRYFNFGVIVFLFLKYGKTPLMNFIRGPKEKLAREIGKIEKKKKEAVEKIEEARKTLEESKVRFADLKTRVVEQGEKKKEALIEEAHQQSANMIEDTRRKIGYQILQAKNAIRAEMLDAAIDLALERLPQEITDEDNQRFLDQYLASAMLK